jgi:hypothetical protein
MTASQALEAEVFDSMEPSGYNEEWMRTAYVVATLRNLFRGKDDEPVSVEDCMPKDPHDKKPEKRQSPALIAAILRGMARGQARRKKKQEKAKAPSASIRGRVKAARDGKSR